MAFPVLDKALSQMEKFLSKIRWLGIISVLGMMILICTDVTCRLFKIAVPGALELQENLLVLNTFALIALMQLRNNHMGIDLIYNRMGADLQRFADTLVSFLTVIILAVLVYESAHSFTLKMGTQSAELYMPMEFYHWMPVCGLGLCLLVSLVQLLRTSLVTIYERKFFSFVMGVAVAAALVYLPFLYRGMATNISPLALGGLAFLLMFTLLLLKMPIGWAMCSVGAIGMIAVARSIPAALATVGTTPYSAVAAYNFVALPMFVLMGTLILYSGVSQDLFDAANKWIGHYPGGMGMASVAGCTGFAAVCGDSMSTAVTMGSVALPEMNRLKYNPRISTGAIAAGGTLGILIPPSSGFIIYGIVTEVSIGRLFLAGIVPGLLLSFLFMLYIYITAKVNPAMAPAGPRYPLKERIMGTTGVLPMIALFVLVLGSIVAGVCSPTEGGAIGAAGAFLYAGAKRKLTRKNVTEALSGASVLSARIMTIMVGVGVLGYFFATTRLPFLLADWIVSLPFNRFVIFAIIIVIYVILGCMMNVIPMLMLTLPSIFPTVMALGFDPVWFGVVSVMVMEMGQITPPVGVVVFALAGVAKGVPMETIFRGIVPFVGMILFGVLLITLVPDLATWLPYKMMGPEVI